MLHAFPHTRTRTRAHVCTRPSSGPRQLSPDCPFPGVGGVVSRKGASGGMEGRSAGGSWPCGPDGGGSVLHVSQEWLPPSSSCRKSPLPALSSGAAGGTDCPWGRKAPRACFSLSGDCAAQGRGREGGCLRGYVHVFLGTCLPLHRHQQHQALGGAAQGAGHWGASGVHAPGVAGALGTVPLSE